MGRLYTVATNVQVAANGQVPLGSVVRRRGGDIILSGPDAMCFGCGYYDVTSSVTLVPDAAGTIGVAAYVDGVQVPGAYAQGTGAVGSPLNLTVVGTFRHVGCGGSSVSLRLVSGDATTGATIQNAATRIED